MAKHESTPFEKLLAEAIDVERELAALDDPRAWQLSPVSFDRLALEAANVTDTEFETFAAKFEERQPKAAMSALTRMTRYLDGSTGFAGTTSVLTRLNGFIDDAALAELAAIHGTPQMLFCLAGRRVAETLPEAFGHVEDPDELRARHNDLRARRDQMHQELEGVWTGDDVEILTDTVSNDLRDQGYARIRFKIAPNVYLGSHLGERLVAAMRYEVPKAA